MNVPTSGYYWVVYRSDSGSKPTPWEPAECVEGSWWVFCQSRHEPHAEFIAKYHIGPPIKGKPGNVRAKR